MITKNYGLRTTDYGRRPGFTLVEMLVVIAIIVILVSLLAAAVSKAINTAEDAANRTEISKLEAAIESFKQHFGVKYLPSLIWLDETLQYNAPPTNLNDYIPPGPQQMQILNQLLTDSQVYLKQLWPQLAIPAPSPAGYIDWNGDGIKGNSSLILGGDQTLVFFLGGIPARSGVAVTGFSTNKRDPAWHVANGGDVIQPFYDFKSDRLARLHFANTPQNQLNLYFSYLDYHGRSDANGNPVNSEYKPFAYFSSYKAGNDYNRYMINGQILDCFPLKITPTQPLQPYIEAGTNPVIFINRNGYQIISAGADRKFGPGGAWSAATASQVYPQGSPGADDQANFHPRKLGD